MKFENRKTFLGIFFLIAIEQLIKIVINNNFLDKRFDILPPILYFEPMFNRKYSWFNSMLGLGNTKWIHIIGVSILTILIYLFYRYLNIKIGKSKMINFMFAFVLAGALCSLIDKVFWDGSLDYILVEGFFTFDLKDVYINIFNGLLILSMFLKNNPFEKLEGNGLVKDFVRFVLRKA